MASVSSRKSDSVIYEEVLQYLLHGAYPDQATKQDKTTIRKRAKKFKVVDGVLHYIGDKEVLRQVHALCSLADYVYDNFQVIVDEKLKEQILEACHNDRVGGCHFGRDRTSDKVTARYYWLVINKYVENWVCT